MPEVWFTLKKSLACTKSLLCDVHEPKAGGDSIVNETTDGGFHGCLRCKSNLKGFICRSRRHIEKPPVGSSSRSTASSGEIINPMISNFLASSATFGVTELFEGDWSRKVIELICERSWSKSMNNSGHIEKIFRVHNSPKTLYRFEEHREMVKRKASKLQKENPRCLVDGNELLGFHGTTLACSLVMHGFSVLCNLESCGVCQILRHGFERKEGNDEKGVFTCAASGKAFESTVLNEEDRGVRRALMICRVIAGRIYNGAAEEDELKADSGFDSLGVKMGLNSKFEGVRVLNPRAVLPCFLVTYKRD